LHVEFPACQKIFHPSPRSHSECGGFLVRFTFSLRHNYIISSFDKIRLWFANHIVFKMDTCPNMDLAQRQELEMIESKIRSHVYSARLRISEYFKDYDRLHSGYISKSRFRRCLALSVEKGILLVDRDFEVLCCAYDTRQNNTVNYNAFIDSIDKGNFCLSASMKVENSETIFFKFSCPR
jgi:hypothetical protein